MTLRLSPAMSDKDFLSTLVSAAHRWRGDAHHTIKLQTLHCLMWCVRSSFLRGRGFGSLWVIYACKVSGGTPSIHALSTGVDMTLGPLAGSQG